MTRSTSRQLSTQYSVLSTLLIALSAGRLPAQSPHAPHYIGVSSCTAAACHGRPQQPDRPAWQSAYTVWATQDPHSNAYATLFQNRSRRIVQILHGEPTSSEQYQQILKQRCIGCHAAPGPATELAAGVSCEACHGPASAWLEPHTRTSWAKVAANERQSLYGQTNTFELSDRAAVCMRCHVGPGGSDGQLHDVNHDLIAAGHPRLNFEFSAYLARLPAHWDVARDRAWADKSQQVRRTDFDTEAWLAGQTVSLRAALSLLRARTASAATEPAVWPEFAEYDCYACHRGLTPDTSGRGSTGRPTWSTWHTPLPRWLAKQSGDEALTADLDALGAELMRPLPRAGVAADLAAQSLKSLDQLERRFARTPPTRAELLAGLSRQSGNWRNWDESAQWYLAIAALAGSYDPANEPHTAQPALAAFRNRLEQYEFNSDHPQFREALERLLEQLK